MPYVYILLSSYKEALYINKLTYRGKGKGGVKKRMPKI